MPRQGDKWLVARGDCLVRISESVYGTYKKWPSIADLNGIKRSKPTIYPGQLLKLPGITQDTGPEPPEPIPASIPPSNKVTMVWWALEAGEDKTLFARWEHSKDHTAGYEMEIYYDVGDGTGWRIQDLGLTTTNKEYTVSVSNNNAKKVKFRVKPYAEEKNPNTHEKYWTDGEFVDNVYDFSDNPPEIPNQPSITLRPNKTTLYCEMTNISQTINADQIEFEVYNNNQTKYKTGTANINQETHATSFECELEPGGSYTVRCRAVRNSNGKRIEGGWTEFTEAVKTVPIAPEEITDLSPEKHTEQGVTQYRVNISWTPVRNATQYVIQYTTDPSLFDTPSEEGVTEIEVDAELGNSYKITQLELGYEYFFRVCASNDSGRSGFTPIKSIAMGSQPNPPTTWSNTSNALLGEDLILYWQHNATDNSQESIAQIHITVGDMQIDKVVHNSDRPEEERDKPNYYIINSNDPEWNFIDKGTVIKWKVKTAGLIDTYSNYSVEREINVYEQPSLTIDIKNQNGVSVEEINSFPFYINIHAEPYEQIPVSYYIEVVANQGYSTVDSTGKIITINPGDRVYRKYYDPEGANVWDFVAEMTPGNIDLQNGIEYTINAVVAMNSGLSASNSMEFSVLWEEIYYDVYANVVIDKTRLEASIHPYCYEYQDDGQGGEPEPVLVENCKLNVYRKEYDGTFTLIAKDVDNSSDIYVTDPHPSLDYARYRITAVTQDNGAISYCDIQGYKIGEPSIVIQWAEAWSTFEVDEEGNGNVEPEWSGSMVKIPYNVDVSEKAKVDVSLVNYAGRTNPVSYYGTQINENATWNCVIPADDKETIYSLRRLAKWAGDVYVREPSGVGYWANIEVNFNINHTEVTIPVSFTVTRVEGGI